MSTPAVPLSGVSLLCVGGFKIPTHDAFLLQIREDVESTELALAFQLGSNIAEDEIICQPQKQPVFAYLPLRSFGFRFIIQGQNQICINGLF